MNKPVVVLYGQDPAGRTAAATVRALRAAYSILVHRDGDAFAHDLRSGHAAILVCAIVTAEVIRLVRAASTVGPAILIAPTSALRAATQSLRNLPIELRLVEAERIPVGLLREVTVAFIEGTIMRWRRAILRDPSLSGQDELRAGLLLMLEAPPRSLNAMAKTLGCSVRKLEEQWASSLRKQPDGLSLKRRLMAAQFVRSLRLRAMNPGLSVGDVAGALGVTPNTLRHHASVFAGTPFTRIALSAMPGLLEDLEPEVGWWGPSFA